MKNCYPLLSLLLVPCLGMADFYPGADPSTPSRSEYFSWINNTNEGPTDAQTRINLEFFRWLNEQYGMRLDIYAFDAGAIDGANFYGSMDSDRFRRQFPQGFGPIAREAAGMGTRLGIWGGPDGFGNTPESELARIEQTVSLCREYNFELFKMDAVCGPLRPEKYEAFDQMMTECRQFSPNLILLNHRLDLGPGTRHSTTYLLGGAETYIDVHMANAVTAPHHRACALDRELPPNLTRMTEDHGVCLSSCLDFWEDDLVLQAFNRGLILAPQIYGNPWLLADSEYPRLAQIFNQQRRYGNILVNGQILPESAYGKNAVSRGDGKTRLITLRNLSWESRIFKLHLDDSIGLNPASCELPVQVKLLHPWCEVIQASHGDQSDSVFKWGDEVPVTVLPFRTALVRVSCEPDDAWEIYGCSYEVIRDVSGQPLEIRLLGDPGSNAKVTWKGQGSGTLTVDGATVETNGVTCLEVNFKGEPVSRDWHRKLVDLQPAEVLPDDAEALYEATCFAADNNALEVRCLERSGPTRIDAVQRARDAFFEQPIFFAREIWDKNLFDGDTDTGFSVNLRWGDPRIKGGAFRLDLGEIREVDHILLNTPDEFGLQPLKSEEGVTAWVSRDLKSWKAVTFLAGRQMDIDLSGLGPWRYLRIDSSPLRLMEVSGSWQGTPVDRTQWRASNLFAPYREQHWNASMIFKARKAWTAAFTVEHYWPGAYLCVAVEGIHGSENVTAAFRMGDRILGCPDRAPSFPSNTWECAVRGSDRNNTFFLPISEDMVGKQMEVIVIGMDPEHLDLKPVLWQSAYPVPFQEEKLLFSRMVDR